MPVKIRKLRSSDRDDVMEISRHVWEGHDYLPGVFESWLNDENSHFYGAEVDGRVVAVANLRLLEGGRTGWMEGLRVHPDCRGKGYANEMTHLLVQKAEDLGVERLRYTTGDNNAASLRLASMAGLQRLLEKAVFWCVKPKKASTVQGYLPIEEATPARAFALLETNPSLVPQRVLVYDWKAADSTPENFKEIGQDHEFLVALKNGKLDSMSFGHSRQDLEKTYGFTVYASDSKGFLAQLSLNMTRALELGSDSVMGTFEREFEETLQQVDFGCDERDTGHLVLLEKQLKQTNRRQRKGVHFILPSARKDKN
jgi:N-acetylglutamate synthase-like GNAT family acetyltransferase